MKKKLIIVLIILYIFIVGCVQKTDNLFNIIGLNEIGSQYGIKIFNGLDGKKIELNERFMIEFEGLLKQIEYIDKKRLSRFPLEPGGYIAILFYDNKDFQAKLYWGHPDDTRLIMEKTSEYYQLDFNKGDMNRLQNFIENAYDELD